MRPRPAPVTRGGEPDRWEPERPTYVRAVGECGVTISYTGEGGASLVLALTEGKDGIMAGPTELLTDGIRRAIHADRDRLIRRLLIAEAFSYYKTHVEATTSCISSPAAKAGYAELCSHDRLVNDAFYDSGMEEFKRILKRWLKRGLAAYHAHRCEHGTTSTEGTGTDGAPLTPPTPHTSDNPAQTTLLHLLEASTMDRKGQSA